MFSYTRREELSFCEQSYSPASELQSFEPERTDGKNRMGVKILISEENHNPRDDTRLCFYGLSYANFSYLFFVLIHTFPIVILLFKPFPESHTTLIMGNITPDSIFR